MFDNPAEEPSREDLHHLLQEMLSDERAENLLEQEAEMLNSLTSTGVKGVAPTIRIFGRRNGGEYNMAVGLNDIPDDGRTKHGMVHMLGRTIAQHKSGIMPLALVMRTEAWVATQSADAKTRVMPRDDPNRVEAAIITLMTFDGRTALRAYELRRRTDETIVLIPKPLMRHEVSDGTKEDSACTSPLLQEFFMGYALAKMGEPVPECYADMRNELIEIGKPDDDDEDEETDQD